MKDRSSVVLIGLILFLGESKIGLRTFARISVRICDFFEFPHELTHLNYHSRTPYYMAHIRGQCDYIMCVNNPSYEQLTG